MLFNSRVSYSIIVFIMSMILLFITRPKLAFENDGSLKSFGIFQKKDTVYSVGVISVLLSLMIFYFFCMIDLIFD
jgi:hypothetical protein